MNRFGELNLIELHSLASTIISAHKAILKGETELGTPTTHIYGGICIKENDLLLAEICEAIENYGQEDN